MKERETIPEILETEIDDLDGQGEVERIMVNESALKHLHSYQVFDLLNNREQTRRSEW